MTHRPLRLVTGVVGAGFVLGAVAASYAATRPAESGFVLQPARLAAAAVPPAAPAAPSRTARSATPGATGTLPSVAPSWVATYAARTGLPARVLTAYADAALRAPCRVGWTTLAGIGTVESGNGTVDGRPVDAGGHPAAPILGPVLDGHGAVAALRGPDGGWARAVGPMQFLPSTWAQWATDGDGDGVADPQDLDDAASAAARYLCASGQDLSTGSGWTAAVRSYNHSDAYVRAVYAAAAAYAAR